MWIAIRKEQTGKYSRESEGEGIQEGERAGNRPDRETIHRAGEEEFQIQPLSESTARVRHKDQEGWFGVNLEPNPARPYGVAITKNRAGQEGIRDSVFTAETPDEALRMLCTFLRAEQERYDSITVTPVDMREDPKKTMGEFLDRVADGGKTRPTGS